jgi:hypothetical protein
MEGGWRRAYWWKTGRERGDRKKEEFPGIMGNMPPGNSFPQICVVSINKSVENFKMAQDYRRSA